MWKKIGFLFGFILLMNHQAYSNMLYPYSSGQAVFVQSPYASSLYTNYHYNQHESAPQRLPPHTTNQAVFVQQPYATTQQTVTPYPTMGQRSLRYSESGYASPTDYPSTVVPAYPYGRVSAFPPASPYTTTTQYPSYEFPYLTTTYTTTETYPFFETRQTIPYTTIGQPSPFPSSHYFDVQDSLLPFPGNAYNASLNPYQGYPSIYSTFPNAYTTYPNDYSLYLNEYNAYPSIHTSYPHPYHNYPANRFQEVPTTSSVGFAPQTVTTVPQIVTPVPTTVIQPQSAVTPHPYFHRSR